MERGKRSASEKEKRIKACKIKVLRRYAKRIGVENCSYRYQLEREVLKKIFPERAELENTPRGKKSRKIYEALLKNPERYAVMKETGESWQAVDRVYQKYIKSE